MTRKIAFFLSGFPSPVIVSLLGGEERALADQLWRELETPVRLWSWHTASSGDWWSCKVRPPHHKPKSSMERLPRHFQRMSDIGPGSLVYPGPGTFSFAYGPKVTEPLAGFRPVVAKADDERLFFEAGRHVFACQYERHQLVTITASRREH